MTAVEAWVEVLGPDEQAQAQQAVLGVDVPADDDAGTRLVLARTYEFFGLYSDAIQLYQEAAKSFSGEASIYELLGEAYMNVDLIELAKTAFDRAKELRERLGDQAR